MSTSITHEAMVELIVGTLEAVDGAGSDLVTGWRNGEWLEVQGNLDVHHLASDVLAAMEPRTITLSTDRHHWLVDALLEYNGTPRRRLFEYPHRDDDSLRMIQEAEKLLEVILNELNKEQES